MLYIAIFLYEYLDIIKMAQNMTKDGMAHENYLEHNRVSLTHYPRSEFRTNGEHVNTVSTQPESDLTHHDHGRSINRDVCEPIDEDHTDCLGTMETIAAREPGDRSFRSTTSTAFSSMCSVEDLEKGVETASPPQTAFGERPPMASGLTLVARELNSERSSFERSFEKPNGTMLKNPDLHPLPAKSTGPAWRRLRHHLVTVYQRLFSLVFIGNAIAILVTLVLHKDKQPFGPSLRNVATAVAANVTCAILMRQEYIINALYDLFCLTPLCAPLRVRRIIAKLYHFGGVHSGAAISAVLWFILFTSLLTQQYVQGVFRSTTAFVVTYALLVLFLLICIFALPRLRIIFHNTFESIHRFGGWLAVGLFWVLILLINHAQSQTAGSPTLGRLILRAPAFWFLVVTTACIILPWLRLRKVPVHAENLSSHAIRLHFSHIQEIGPVLGIRLATSPLKEWHAFATIPSASPEDFSVIISDAGDWTKKQIENPQPSYWVRGIPIRGVLRMAGIFKSVVIVATGSGIGPVLSFVMSSRCSAKTRLLWSTPNPLQTFGQGIIDSVNSADKDAMIWNTREKGRPNMVALAYHLYAESEAEAVFVISNSVLTKKMVYALESRGVPAYGPIWDS